jgi:hypothetical protein
MVQKKKEKKKESERRKIKVDSSTLSSSSNTFDACTPPPFDQRTSPFSSASAQDAGECVRYQK